MASATFQPTADQQKKLTAAGIDWQKVLQTLGTIGAALLQALLAALQHPQPPTPPSSKQGVNLPKAVDCPDPSDGNACCCCCMQNILLAGLACESTRDGDSKQCCQGTLHYLLKAVECCSAHCCH